MISSMRPSGSDDSCSSIEEQALFAESPDMEAVAQQWANSATAVLTVVGTLLVAVLVGMLAWR